MVALDEAGGEQEQADEDAGECACEVCGVGHVGAADHLFEDILADFKEDEVEGGDFPDVDVDEYPYEHADLDAGKEHEEEA